MSSQRFRRRGAIPCRNELQILFLCPLRSFLKLMRACISIASVSPRSLE